MRKRLNQILELAADDDYLSKGYDFFMIVIIVASLIPLATRSQSPVFTVIDNVAVTIFVIDYFLRWIVADYKLGKGKKSFFLYPFSFMAIVDVLSILPFLSILGKGFMVFRTFRLVEAMRVIRVIKGLRYSKNLQILMNVIRKQGDDLIMAGLLAVGYIIISALVVFNAEPETFPTYFDALYWATVSLTAVGYGDIFAVSITGRVITMISAFFGVAIVAVPAGIITAGYMKVLAEDNEE